MNRRIRFVVLLLLLAPLASLTAAAQTLTVAYADPEVIITYLPEYKTIQAQVAAEYKTSQEALQALAEDFQERVARYQKQQPLLSAERQKEREQELSQLQAEIQDSAARKDQELSSRQDSLMAPLLQKVQGVIDEVAAEKGLDIVIRSPTLLYVNQDKIMNINLDIAKKLGIEIDESKPPQ